MDSARDALGAALIETCAAHADLQPRPLGMVTELPYRFDHHCMHEKVKYGDFIRPGCLFISRGNSVTGHIQQQ